MPGPHIVDWHSNDTLFLAFFGINDMVRDVWAFLLIGNV
jgi:hypothetical protein